MPLVVAIHSVGGHHRDLIAVFGPVIGGASIFTGLAAWQRRPDNRFGALLVAVGFTYCLSGLIVTTDSWPFISGLALIALPYAILFHILLAFPSGRLTTRFELALAALMYGTATVLWWACMVIEDTGAFGLPANPLLIADEPSLFDVLSRARLGVVAALIGVLGVVIVRRWLVATRPSRRALTLVYFSGGLVLALYAIWSVLGMLDVATGLQETLERARVIALATVPFAFLAGLLRARVVGAGAVNELVARLGAGPATCRAPWRTRCAIRRWRWRTGFRSGASGSTRAGTRSRCPTTSIAARRSSATGRRSRCSSTTRRWPRSPSSCTRSGAPPRWRWRTSG